MSSKKSIIVIGAGFFGLNAALILAKAGYKVEIHERNHSAMQEASLFNQARVHGGYHYPRSLATAARCRANYERFITEYREAITEGFDSTYAIAADSKVSPQKFSRLMKMIGAPIKELSGSNLEQFDRSLISAAYNVTEVAFDSSILLQIMLKKCLILMLK
jgi:glycine/D-amino acid oxidase-like deaminating enzyme